MGVGQHQGRTAGSQLLEPGVWSWLRGEGLSRDLEDGPASLGIHQGTVRRQERGGCIYPESSLRGFCVQL